ncbi:hypothetical protein GLAREA_08679 [Glarea lozoyensis ATCC 20868]|uniref:Uncharacterized protein n=1 Tax=Glarea lozoyensis (strain ATCC 20868 / MF5171) TaxID=1116229 RepID=S3DX24_GLAL2|nr:uncharacterized protein GLAREA_08679 [Glarea lozoyensis ATCC 20868]EPE36516.1 hypothetical protein GLAREA_08679 [Glarea lozoyensis ATCC 20868]
MPHLHATYSPSAPRSCQEIPSSNKHPANALSEHRPPEIQTLPAVSPDFVREISAWAWGFSGMEV